MGESRQNLEPRSLRGNESPISWNMLTVAPSATGQGTWARAVADTLPYCGYFWNSSSNDGDEFDVDIYATRGTYTISFGKIMGPNAAILDIDVDGTEVGSVDLYKSTNSYTTIALITDISLESGKHTFTFRVDGKNASSGNYRLFLAKFSLIRTA